ncbi:hypothetical protein [Pseudoalteromonas lipolytica]|uniref:hypothetical protein n=1 Tax=Pseudoalteromonas lipolytica TaxID=570156 RepID=UPI0030B0C56E
MRAFGLLSFGYVPFIIIAAIVFGAISYVFSVFEVMNRLTSTYLDMGLLQASIMYLSMALLSSIAAPALIFIKRKTRSETYRVTENQFQQSLIFFGSLYALTIVLLYSYISIRLSWLYTLDLVTLLAYILQFIVLYHIFTITWALLRGAWQAKERTMKTIFCIGLLVFLIAIVLV